MNRLVDKPETKAGERRHAFFITAARWLLAAALLGSMLFAHGCHGDEDHELFTSCMGWISK